MVLTFRAAVFLAVAAGAAAACIGCESDDNEARQIEQLARYEKWIFVSSHWSCDERGCGTTTAEQEANRYRLRLRANQMFERDKDGACASGRYELSSDDLLTMYFEDGRVDEWIVFAPGHDYLQATRPGTTNALDYETWQLQVTAYTTGMSCKP